ncbi:hypothetical protein AB0C84_40360 [Actinomadura sp. NPDC048955]|uniref:hypothetical protein n=1 Tax=Actinomadura sp. NPDC048955 TaxID=3158228 RepID=UPI0033DC3C29
MAAPTLTVGDRQQTGLTGRTAFDLGTPDHAIDASTSPDQERAGSVCALRSSTTAATWPPVDARLRVVPNVATARLRETVSEPTDYLPDLAG